MNLGFDMDGCLAQFIPAYQQKFRDVTGKDLFDGQVYGPDYPKVRNFELDAGYTPAEVEAVWKSIAKDENFWLELPPLDGAEDVVKILDSLRIQGHNIYFITDRPGVTAKRQSEIWLKHYGLDTPTVLVTPEKSTALLILKLDAYIDDKLSHANDCMTIVRRNNLTSRVYLKDAPYNQRPEAVPIGDGIIGEQRRDVGLKVVGSVGEMLREEGLA